MGRKAVIVGINKYPGAPLRGCVNDATDMANFLTKYCGYRSEDIRLLVDNRATTAAIFERLDWLIQLQPNDFALFHFSGHGVQYAGRGSNQEVDRLNEVICPYDFDWTENRMISDKQFVSVFSRMPFGVRFNWINDSCHSGDLTRKLAAPGDPIEVPRTIEVPPDMAWRISVAKEKGISSKAMSNGVLDTGFVSGCRSDQTSADTQDASGRPCGALTNYFLRTAATMPGKSLREVVAAVNQQLTQHRYDQRPQCEGAQADLQFQK